MEDDRAGQSGHDGEERGRDGQPNEPELDREFGEFARCGTGGCAGALCGGL